MTDKPVLTSQDDGVVTITLNRPDLRNAMTVELTDAFVPGKRSAPAEIFRGSSPARKRVCRRCAARCAPSIQSFWPSGSSKCPRSRPSTVLPSAQGSVSRWRVISVSQPTAPSWRRRSRTSACIRVWPQPICSPALSARRARRNYFSPPKRRRRGCANRAGQSNGPG